MIAYIDFETYYDDGYKLTSLSTEEFIRDPRFEVLGLGVAVDDGPATFHRSEITWRPLVEAADIVCAHHAAFDGAILSWKYGIKPKAWRDTMALGRLHHWSGSLRELAITLGIGAKGTTLANTKGRRASQISEAMWQTLGEYCCNDVTLMRDILSRLGPITPAAELEMIDTVVRWFSEPIFELDREMLLKALAAERAKKAKLLTAATSVLGFPTQTDLFSGAPSLEGAREVVASAPKFASALRRLGVVVPTKPGAKGEIAAVAKTDAFMTRCLTSEDPRVATLAKARQATTSNLGETRAETLSEIAARGTFPIYINYSAAHTHRFSGGDGCNIQNFTRGSLLRDAVCAPKGHVCVVADLSQIEARGVAWLAGQTDLLGVFREADTTGGDFYSMFGSQVFRRPINKHDHPVERQIAKSMVLGLGYGMGTETFGINLLSAKTQFSDSDAAKFDVDVEEYIALCGERRDKRTDETAIDRAVEKMGRPYEAMATHLAVTDYFVALYRTTYPAITELWMDCDRVIAGMATTARPYTWRTVFTVGRGTITKPSGLVLRYPHIRKDGRRWSYSEGALYGGLLTENIVQSISRDVLCDMLLRVQARGYRSRMTVHDELVVVVPEADGHRALDDLISEMRVAPTWCKDWPMNAAGGVHQRWGKAKT